MRSRWILPLVLGLLLSPQAFAKAEKKLCSKRYESVSCSAVNGNKRSHFCVRKGRKVGQDKIAKICKTVAKKKSTQNKKSTKTKS